MYIHHTPHTTWLRTPDYTPCHDSVHYHCIFNCSAVLYYLIQEMYKRLQYLQLIQQTAWNNVLPCKRWYTELHYTQLQLKSSHTCVHLFRHFAHGTCAYKSIHLTFGIKLRFRLTSNKLWSASHIIMKTLLLCESSDEAGAFGTSDN